MKIQVLHFVCMVSDNVSSLILGIQCSLRRGINLNCKFNVEFRLDVFSYLFSGKGTSLFSEIVVVTLVKKRC